MRSLDKHRLRTIAMSFVAVVGACLDDHPGPVGPTGTDGTRAAPTAIVSDPRPQTPTPATRAGASRSAGAVAGTDVVYVSLQPGAVPNGGLATIRNTRTSGSVAVAMHDGGFDPVRIDARVDDTVAVEVKLVGGDTRSLVLVVRSLRPPGVVRTDPGSGKRDVPLNTTIMVVFSEPISQASVGGIQLLLGGTAVSGHIELSADGLRATFQPDGLLAPNTVYTLFISADVVDLSGDPLPEAVTAEFTTGTTTAVASVFTAAPALFVNPSNGEERAFESDAVLGEDGRVTGTWTIFYARQGNRISGRVTCFTIVDGKAAWVAGVADSNNSGTTPPGTEYGWRVVDNGPPEGGVPDQLSLAYSLADFGTAQDWCASTPVFESPSVEVTLYKLISGDVVVSGVTPPPPPPLPPGAGMSQIAYAAIPSGGIMVRRADGTGVRTLTDTGFFNPAWSPDGFKLTFDGERATPGNGDIYAINYDGSGITQLTSGPADDRAPAWSPDGARITFVRDGTIRVMNAADGSGIEQLTAGPDDHPAWSPDGTKIAFARSNQIYVVNADGTGLTPLTTGPGIDDKPAWSADGTRIVFEHSVRSRWIATMNADGTSITELVNGTTPVWSPDGTKIVFYGSYFPFGLFIVNADGTGMRPIWSGYTPAWSPVGTMPASGYGPAVATPSNVNVVAVSANAIAVSWQDNANNERFFQVHRSITGSDGAFDLLTSLGPNRTSYSDSGLTAGGQYCYRVRALSMFNDPYPTYSAYSNTACATTPLPAATVR